MPRKSNPVDTTQDIPKWWREVYDKYTAGIAHAFLLHFNVCDYTAPESAMNLRTYLTAMLANRKIIVFYNRAEGITFPREEMEEEFRKLLELDAQKEDTALAIALGGTSGGKQPLPRDPAEALGLIEQLLTLGDVTQNSIMVIIDYAEAVVPNADMATMSPADRNVLTILRRWGTMPRIVRSGNPIFLITESLTDLHQSIRTASSKWEAVEVPLPDPETRKKYIQLKKEDSKKFEWELTPEAMANSTAGLSLVHIEDIFLRAAQEGNLTAELVLERKTSIIASEYAEVLEILEPRMGFEMIGGLEYVKRAFQTRVIDPMREGRRNQVPMGVLMTGPAGTGKTAVAEAVAREAKVNFLILNLARIYGQYVGNSERNLEKAWRAILALAPSIVFIDEVDQAMQRGGSGDSGVSSRIFKRLLEVMSDTSHRGKVVFLAASNRPDLMDAALRRPGRFDLKIPFFLPNPTEREMIFQVMAKKYSINGSLVVPPEAVQGSDGWTGAEIELATVKAVSLMEIESMDSDTAIAEAVKRISPSTADTEFMTNLALSETNDIDLVPEEMKGLLRNRKDLNKKLKELREESEPTWRGARGSL